LKSGIPAAISTLLLVLAFGYMLPAQVPVQDSLVLSLDSLPLPDSLMLDSLAADSTRPLFPDILVSEDALDARVEYDAQDSIHFSVREQKVYLYGNAFVQFQTTSLRAGYMEVNLKDNIVTAEGFPDSSGTVVGLPEFQDGEQSFVAKRMRYNFKNAKRSRLWGDHPAK
jgi:hypothetical protein